MLHRGELLRGCCALAVATLMATRGLRSRSLAPGGAAAAFLVGFVTWSAALRFGVTLIAFYLLGTRTTRYGADIKSRVEDGFVAAAGNRGAAQVLASSLPAVVFSILYVVLFRYDAPITPAFPLRSTILLAYLLYFAACAGDTFSSELGIVQAARDPMLITAPWRRVPRGTNGGVSAWGTLASGLGGLLMGCVFFATSPEYVQRYSFCPTLATVLHRYSELLTGFPSPNYWSLA